ncbi:putative signal transducing protein [Sorangium sp. So ce1335]|uniref:putative signal transducing protein n=1 Tax=Sorangium sp. So ce1335 TaxID=3133335 RepID=UPI003F5DBC43
MRSSVRPLGGAPAGSEQLVTVATYSESVEAQMARSALSAHGVRAFIADEHVATLTPHYIGRSLGIRLQVPRADLERAAEILKPPAVDDDRELDEEDEAAEIDGPKCPACGARYAYREWALGQILVILALLGLPLLVMKKRWHCRKCHAYWAPETPAPRAGNPYRTPRGAALRAKT